MEKDLALAKESGSYDEYKASVIAAFEEGTLSAEEARELIGKSMAPACQTSSYNPLSFNPLINMASTSCKIDTFSAVISPKIRIAKPGPGNGCLPNKSA